MKNVVINDRVTIYYPLKLVPRKQQIEAFTFIKESINSGNKFILLDLPTGAGKSYIPMMLMNWYKNFVDVTASCDILTNSKILQEQYMNDHDVITNLKGKSNYWCKQYNTDCEKGEELCKAMKSKCDHCPYKSAVLQWINSDISLTNFHMFDTLSVFVPDKLRERKSRLLIIDEAHDFDAVFSDYMTTKINARLVKKFGMNDREVRQIDSKLRGIRSVTQYAEFIENYMIERMESLQGAYSAEIASKFTSDKKKKEVVKYLKAINNNLKKFENFLKDFNRDQEDGETAHPQDNWVLEMTTNDKEVMYSGIDLTVQPVWSYSYLNKYVWDHYDHVIFMSGTLLDNKLINYINGLDESITKYKQFDSPFNPKRRPIYYMKLGKMTYNDKVATFQEQKKWIKKILAKNKDKKGIIHTNSYELAEWIQTQIPDKRFLFHDNENRDEILRLHKESDDPTVLVSPSMTTGVDLKGDYSRFQIILKIPYPNISSNKIKQRQKTNQYWYGWKTVVDFIQSYGRSVRSVDDWAETYVLDSSFSNILAHNAQFLPDYITEAIKIIKV